MRAKCAYIETREKKGIFYRADAALSTKKTRKERLIFCQSFLGFQWNFCKSIKKFVISWSIKI